MVHVLSVKNEKCRIEFLKIASSYGPRGGRGEDDEADKAENSECSISGGFLLAKLGEL
jgi:hypothetical protein